MDTKYYIPDISEFHVGFEYERMNGTDWEKAELTNVDCWGTMARGYENEFEEIDSLIRSVRVKYLDKEDIESLGFKCEEEDVLSTLYSQFNRRFSMLVDNGYFIHIGMMTLSDRVILTIDTSVYENSEKTKVIHSIRIKNKSELKQILKMIGYENSIHS